MPQIIERRLVYYAIGGKIIKRKLTPISHDKMTHLVKHCVTMNELMDKFYDNTDMSYVICEECSKLSYKSSKVDFKKHQSVLKPPMNIIIFLQIPEYNFERDEYCKNKTKTALPSQYSMHFSDKHNVAVYILVAINIHVVNGMDGGNYVCT